ncbi:MAG: hypothetical protein KatS3mg111_3906 [Pirellulaceae bacterium]|nr:MAG: hypothetical protein KatS3mg111_3906 [Pirellulaceae bacterium]
MNMLSVVVLGAGAETNAALWLSLLLLISLFYGWHLFLRGPYSFVEACLYVPCYLLGRILWRVTFLNTPPAEMKLGAVLAANHRSSVDPFFVQLAAQRRVHWMVAKEYCDHPLFGIVLRALQVIPTNRSGVDTRATKSAIRLVRSGRLVGMFPEGRLNQTAAPLLPVRSGAALVAIKAGAPLIPLWIEGSPFRREVWSPFFMPANVRITFGRPLWPSSSGHGEVAHSASNVGAPETHHVASGEEARQLDQRAEQDGPRSSDSDEADRLTLLWAQEVLRLAGKPNYPVQLARRRR